LKRIALVLCAILWALGAGVVTGAQGTKVSGASGAGTVGTVQAVDETSLAIGDRTTPPLAGDSLAGPSILAYFLRMIVVLAVVLACIYGVFRLMRRLSRPRETPESPLKIVVSASLGPGKNLHIVSLGTRAYLVGATDSTISLIANIEDRELVDSLVLKAALEPRSASSAQGGRFSSTLASLLSSGSRQVSRKSSRPGDFLADQRDRLRNF
jgi:flagellar protein FliO/FliZ